MNTHHLKILPEYFDQQVNGFKRFEIRKNDRNFKVFDEITLNEISGHLAEKDLLTGRSCRVRITYILNSTYHAPFEGVEEGYCILSTELIK